MTRRRPVRFLCAALPVAALLALALLPAQASATLVLVQQFGGLGSGNGQLNEPTDVAAAPSGELYVSDRENHRIQKFTNDGQFLLAWGGLGGAPGQFMHPNSIAVDGGGSVYVTDRGNTRVQKFDPNGTFLTQWGTPGSGPGQFGAGSVWGVATDAAGNVYVNESGNNRVQKFTPDGTFLTAFGGPGSAPGQFRFPHGMSFDSAGNLHVTDRDNHRVQVFDTDGRFLRSFGTRGSDPGDLNAPYDVVPHASGDVYVGEENTTRIQRFGADGAFVSLTRDFGPEPTDLFLPWGMGVDSNGDVLIADRPRHRVIRAREGVPPPAVGKTVTASTVRGTVLVQLPSGAARASQKRGGRFVPLSEVGTIPVGSTLDTRRGVVELTSATDSRGSTQTSRFFSGMFEVRQRPRQALVDLVLKGTVSRRACASRGKATSSQRRRRVRRLWGTGRGRYRTRGRYSAATVRGTKWLVEDRCDGTLTRVREGRVTVRDFVRRRTVTIRAGRSYFARRR